MSETVTYYEITLADGSGDNPAGLARRRRLDHGAVLDEMLRRDLTWQADGVIVGPDRSAASWPPALPICEHQGHPDGSRREGVRCTD